MSMVELGIELTNFLRALDDFNERLKTRWDELQQEHERAAELWPRGDPTREQFENDWGAMSAVLEQYRTKLGSRYLDFIIHKKRAVDGYFGH